MLDAPCRAPITAPATAPFVSVSPPSFTTATTVSSNPPDCSVHHNATCIALSVNPRSTGLSRSRSPNELPATVRTASVTCSIESANHPCPAYCSGRCRDVAHRSGLVAKTGGRGHRGNDCAPLTTSVIVGDERTGPSDAHQVGSRTKMTESNRRAAHDRSVARVARRVTLPGKTGGLL